MRSPLNDRITEIQPSGIRKFFDIVSEMEDAISLGVGEPDFDTPWHVREEGIHSLEMGRTFYTSNAGLKELRVEISNYVNRRFGVSYDPLSECMVTIGGSEAIDLAMRCMLNPGDEVLIPQPSYVSYTPCAIMAGGVPVPIELEEKDEFRLTPEKLLEKIAMNLYGKTTVMNDGVEIDFKAPYKKIGILDAIKEYTGIDVKGMNVDQLRETCKKLHVEIEPSMGVGKLIDAIFGEYCEKHFIQPTFVTDYPVEMSPLTKRHRNDPTLTERFELFVCGHELANAYSELNDPIDQRERFEEQARLKSNGDDEAMFIDYDFLRALEYGMPPTSGLGMGIDRLTMLMTGNNTIQDVLFFPQMRPEKMSKPTEEKDEQ